MKFPGDRKSESGDNIYGCVKQLFLVKKKYRNLKLMLSIGGYSLSGNFTTPASTKQGRKEFAASTVKLYPTENMQPDDMVQLLAETRSALDAYSKKHAQNKHFELTVASPAGSWDQIARHQANIYPSICDPNATQYDIDSAIKYYRSQGVAPEKLVLGMPLYARRFNNTLGLGRAFTHSGQTDAVPYKDLPVSGNNVYNLQQPVASYLYNITSGSLFSYDTPEIISMKARYIMQERLGGACSGKQVVTERVPAVWCAIQ
ncbi:uncharacterized protein ATNIH1004_011683 [Aspergillus tanneri]|uniref:chitinase n=1 Tax=Aspergillus tanneri TaxID=1220188 RepID=A0A5M9MEY7_9EURO|nr:uncharacterized protein ATNIH1004_011683 [Aspergillus tanneri]KAA8641547.1 hypothetical protein ATNIH1004_011683 [Aspergillus tanneri]